MNKNFDKVRASFIKSERQYDDYASKNDFTLDDRLMHIVKMKHHYCCKLHELSKLYELPLDEVIERLDSLRTNYYYS